MPPLFLAGLGRHGPLILAIAVFAGLLVPPLAAALNTLLLPAILLPFLIALVRLDWGRMASHVRHPWTLVAASVWLLLILPFLLDLILDRFMLRGDVKVALVMMAATAPVMGAASLALLVGLNGALAMVVTLVTTALMPFTLPPLVFWLVGIKIDMPLGELMMRLGSIVGGTFLVAWLIRRCIAADILHRHAPTLDGIAVIGLMTFAIGIMDGMASRWVERPTFILYLLATVVGLNLVMQATTALLFARQGRRDALTLGLAAGNRNMGLILAALADRASIDFLTVVAVAQLPIYTLPLVQRWLYRRWLNDQPIDGSSAEKEASL